MKMSTNIASISSNFFKKGISINPLQFHTIFSHGRRVPIPMPIPQFNPTPPLLVSGLAHDPTYIPGPGNSPPDIPRAPLAHNPGLPPEAPRRHNVPEFDPIPPEKPVPPPPSGADPEFPGPPEPEVPPPPGEPEIVPPHGPEITPPKPLGPSPPLPGRPDTPPPIIGSNGLVFY